MKKEIRLIAFDIDGTLAKINTPIPPERAGFLRELKREGLHITLISGKPTAYICGLARQVGLTDIIASGENGAEVYYSATFPPTCWEKIYEGKALEEIRSSLQDSIGDKVWFQPNGVNIAAFPTRAGYMEAVVSQIKETANKFNLQFYIHSDCAEIIAPGVDKGVAIQRILNHLGLNKDQILSVGDSHNDLSMFKASGQAIAIGLRPDNAPDYDHIITVQSFEEAMVRIYDLIKD